MIKAAAVLLLTLCSYAYATDVSSLLKDVDMSAHAIRATSHVTLLPDDEVKNTKILIGGLSDAHLETFREQIVTQTEKLVAARTHSMTTRTQNLISWSKFHEGASGKLKAAGYITFGLAAVVLEVGTFLSPGCGQPNWIVLTAQGMAALGGFFFYMGAKSSEAVPNLDILIEAEISKGQHLVSILDEETRNRIKGNGLVKLRSSHFNIPVRKRSGPLEDETDIEKGISTPRVDAHAEELIQGSSSTNVGQMVVVVDGEKGKEEVEKKSK